MQPTIQFSSVSPGGGGAEHPPGAAAAARLRGRGRSRNGDARDGNDDVRTPFGKFTTFLVKLSEI